MTIRTRRVAWAIVALVIIFVVAVAYQVPEPELASAPDRAQVSMPDEPRTRFNPAESIFPPSTVRPATEPQAALDCSVTDKDIEALWGGFDEDLGRFAAALAESRDAEHRLAAALIGFRNNPMGEYAALQRARVADTEYELTHRNILRLCVEDPAVCNLPRDEQLAIEADGGNGFVWAAVARIRFDRGKKAEALMALINANSAPEFRADWIEHVILIDRALAAVADYDYRGRLIQAWTVSSTMRHMVTDVIGMCQDMLQDPGEWHSACLDFGQRLEADGRTIMSEMSGLALQSLIYEAADDQRNLADVAARKRRHEEAMEFVFSAEINAALLMGEQLMGGFLEEWAAAGEIEAFNYLQREYLRLRGQPGYDPCEFLEDRGITGNE